MSDDDALRELLHPVAEDMLDTWLSLLEGINEFPTGVIQLYLRAERESLEHPRWAFIIEAEGLEQDDLYILHNFIIPRTDQPSPRAVQHLFGRAAVSIEKMQGGHSTTGGLSEIKANPVDAGNAMLAYTAGLMHGVMLLAVDKALRFIDEDVAEARRVLVAATERDRTADERLKEIGIPHEAGPRKL